MLTEKGQLTIGAEYGGKVHRDFELRPLKMRDSVELRASGEVARLSENDEHMGLALMAKRLTIGDIPREAMTLDFMLDMWDEDMAEVMSADARLAKAIRSFRGQASNAKADASGPDEDGVQLSGSLGNAGTGGGCLGHGVSGTQESEARESKEVQSEATA